MTFCPVRQAPNRCKHCGKEKACSDMSLNKSLAHGHTPGLCRGCASAKSRVWRETALTKNERVARAKNYHLRRTFGITLDQYNEMLAEQDGTCKVCHKVDTTDLAVDHCHSTGKVRGLLCGPCNRALGLAYDDPKLLRALAEYLEEA